MDIVIHKADKGNSVVIVDRADYVKKMQEIVEDESKFEEVKEKKEGKDYNFMVKEKSVVDSFLSMLREKNSIDDDLKEKLTPDGPNPA